MTVGNAPEVTNKVYLKCVNVGMGDFSLITLPNLKRVIVDLGSSRLETATETSIKGELPMFAGTVLPIDLLVMTHPDKDHYSLVSLLGDTMVTKIVHSMSSSTYSLYKFRQWYWQTSNIATMQEITVNVSSPAEIELIDGGRGIKLFAVAANVPSASQTQSMQRNTASVVVVCRHTPTNTNLFLIAADATCETENFMLAATRRSRIQNVDLVRIGHHGSDTSSQTAFINVVNPATTGVISSSKDNGIYCLPKESVVNRWLMVIPAGATTKNLGYWQDGAGTQCTTLDGEEDEASLTDNTGRDGSGITMQLPYNYGTTTTRRPLYETFIDGTRSFEWGPF